jgi:hypothetical protein
LVRHWRGLTALAGQTLDGRYDLWADVQTSLLNPRKQGAHLRQMALPFGEQDETKRSADWE